MTELHHKSPHPSEPRLSSSLSNRGVDGIKEPTKQVLSPLPSQQSFQTVSSINMSMESLEKVGEEKEDENSEEKTKAIHDDILIEEHPE